MALVLLAGICTRICSGVASTSTIPATSRGKRCAKTRAWKPANECATSTYGGRSPATRERRAELVGDALDGRGPRPARSGPRRRGRRRRGGERGDRRLHGGPVVELRVAPRTAGRRPGAPAGVLRRAGLREPRPQRRATHRERAVAGPTPLASGRSAAATTADGAPCGAVRGRASSAQAAASQAVGRASGVRSGCAAAARGAKRSRASESPGRERRTGRPARRADECGASRVEPTLRAATAPPTRRDASAPIVGQKPARRW
jgi:hypothetical protein